MTDPNDPAVQQILRRMDAIHEDLTDIREKQTEMVTRLAIGQQVIDKVKDLPLDHALVKQEFHGHRTDAIRRIEKLEGIVAAVVWKVMSYVLGLATVIAILVIVVIKGTAHGS